jgi:hypothetical protein
MGQVHDAEAVRQVERGGMDRAEEGVEQGGREEGGLERNGLLMHGDSDGTAG